MDEKETGRIEAFSDGVFAIAITLLILDIHIEPEKGRTIFDTLAGPTMWHIFAFVISFLTIGIMWINHHRLFVHIKRSDNTLLVLNLLLLFIIVVIPVPTTLLGTHIGDTPNDIQAAAIFNGTFFFMAVCFNILWRYATHKNRLLNPNTDYEAVRSITRQYMFGPLVYLVTFVVGLFSPPLSLLLTFVLSLFFAIPSNQVRLLSQPSAKKGAS